MEKYVNSTFNICMVNDIYAKLSVGQMELGRICPLKTTVQIENGVFLSGENLIQLFGVMLDLLKSFVHGMTEVDGKSINKIANKQQSLVIKYTKNSITFGTIDDESVPSSTTASSPE